MCFSEERANVVSFLRGFEDYCAGDSDDYSFAQAFYAYFLEFFAVSRIARVEVSAGFFHVLASNSFGRDYFFCFDLARNIKDDVCGSPFLPYDWSDAVNQYHVVFFIVIDAYWVY